MPISVPQPWNLRDLLEGQAGDPVVRRRAFHFHSGSDLSVVETLTYEGLADRSRSWGASLQALGAVGERCMLLFPPGTDYIAAFFACIYAGVVAVPTYPPSRRNIAGRFRAVLQDSEPRVLLCTPKIADRIQSLAGDWPELRGKILVTPQELDAGTAGEWVPQRLTVDSLAFLQYTSGSTGSPKGVRITHGNLLHNQRLIQAGFATDGDSVVVGWLPLYHDMGLIGIVLQPLFVGAPCHLMSPLAFLQRPLSWLELIGQVRGTVSGGPSFAYGLCVDKAGAGVPEDLDLSSWEVAFNGSEPVDAGTLERFAATFAPHGFRPEAAYPCYGLAEATLFVSGGAVARPPEIERFDRQDLAAGIAGPAPSGGRPLVSSGRPAADLRLEVVDPKTRRRVTDGRIGEIWLAGDSVADGYWQRRQESQRIFGARLEGTEAGEDAEGWLRTGDLGFRRRGELFISGRLKDLIILRGRNIYPQDVERVAGESHPALLADGAAAFSVEGPGGEELVVVQEIDRRRHGEAPEALEELRRALAEREGLVAEEVVLIRQRTLPRTSSGKVRRRACRAAFEAGELEVVAARKGRPEETRPEASWTVGAAEEGFEDRLRFLVARRLGRAAETLDEERDLMASGLDSLGAMELTHDIEGELGAIIALEELFEGISLGALRELVAKAGAERSASAAPGESPGPKTVELPGEVSSERTEEASVGQESIYFLEQLRPSAARYNVARALRLRAGLGSGKNDSPADRLAAALGRVAQRHDELGQSFALDADGRLRRRRRDGSRLAVIEHAMGQESETDLGAALAEAALRPFDLAHDPLMRLDIFRGGGEDVVVWSAHHLVVDFLSLATLVRQLADEMSKEIPEEAEAPAVVRPSYDAWIRWQTAWLKGERGDRLREFWRRELKALPSPPALPVDRPPPARRSWRAGIAHTVVPPEAWSRARGVAGRQGATPFVLLFAALQILVARLSGERDFLLVTPVATPGPLPVDEPVGYRVNLLPLRSVLEGRGGLEELLGRSRRRVSDALRHRDLPFAHIVEQARSPSPSDPVASDPVASDPVDGEAAGLGRMMLVFYGESSHAPAGLSELAAGVPGAAVNLGGYRLEAVELERRPALFDLQLHAAERADGSCFLGLEADRDLFDVATGERLLGYLRRLLEEGAEAPERPVEALALMDRRERQAVLAAGTAPRLPAKPWQDLLARIAGQMRRTPHAPALALATDGAQDGESRELSYAELGLWALAVQRRLLDQGLEADEGVAVCLRRGPELVATLLGILAAGGFYIPMDPGHPPARLDAMLESCCARFVVSDLELACRWSGAEAVTVLAPPPRPAAEAGTSPAPASMAALLSRRPFPDQLAYAMFTSGSTGRPKAVGIRHGGVAALLDWAVTVFSPEDLRRTLAATPVTFDLSVFELFLPLSVGGTVVLAENVLALPRTDLTLVNTVPSALEALLERGLLPDSVRTVNLAGEALPEALAQRLLEPSVDAAAAKLRLFNLYGPSEDTTYSTFAEITSGDSGAPPIGRAVAGTRAVVMSRGARLQPCGLAGELWLGGAGLARGYLGEPGRTARSFVPDPYPAEPGARMYRTGDLVVQDADGVLRFLGRIDHQVKVRGFRVELGEIEAALVSYPGVREAAVVGSSGPGGSQRLVAYVVGPAAAESRELAEHLRAVLPEYMIPAVWMSLEDLPRNAHGKLHRAALPQPAAPGDAAKEDRAIPGGDYEALVVSLFEAVLEAEEIGADESFFDLGGHSLLASRLVARLRNACEVELALSEIFDHPTPRALARLVAERRGTSAPAAPDLPALADPSPLAPGQERMWLHQQLDPASPVYNLAGCLELEGHFEPRHLMRALNALERRHRILRARFVESAGKPLQHTAPTRRRPLPVADLSGLEEAPRAAAELARRLARKGFALAVEAPFRRALIRLGAGRHQLLLVLHHLVADGESLRLLLRELEQMLAGEQLAPAPVHFQQVARWRRSLSAAESGEAMESRELELPWDAPGGELGELEGARVEDWLPASAADALRGLARRRGVSLFMAVTAVFAELLARLGGSRRMLLGAPVSWRSSEWLERVVGPLVEVAPLELRWEAGTSAGDLLARVRREVLRAVDDQRRGLSSAARAPEVVVAVEPAWPSLRLGEATARCRAIPTHTAKFALSLNAEERRDGSLHLSLEFPRQRLAATTAARWLRSWRDLAQALAEADARDPAMAHLPVLSPAERHQLLVEWNDIATAAASSAVEAIFRWSERAPSRAALKEGGFELTYGELGERAARLAHLLVAEGLGPESVVAVLMPSSADRVVAQLAVLASGAAYLPLDPNQPMERLAWMVDDSGARRVLTDPTLRERWRSEGGEGLSAAVLLDPKEHRPRLAALPATPPAVRTRQDQLAYVVYTSGSTGRPKGVAISRRGLDHLVAWHGRRYGLERRSTQLAGLGFDAAVWEVWPCLAGGGRLSLVDEETRKDPRALSRFLREHRIQTCFLPTPVAEAVLAQDADLGSELEALLTGGDRLRATPPAGLSFAVINHYGPSECSVVTTAGRVDAGQPGPPSIGRPIDDLRVFVAGPEGEPAPLGAAGELLVGGAGLARGYLGRPRSTAERFVPDPWSGLAGERLYRSGDRVRLRGDGTVDFLGRLDRQLEVRGHRIEPGEVEVQLRALTGIEDVLVAGVEGRLVAYWRLEAGAPEPDSDGVRGALRRVLPAYMVPAFFAAVERWPLTANGKIDLAALPLPRLSERSGFVAPRTEIEMLVAEIWSQALGVEPIGVETPFFDLGGHSLQLTQMLSQVAELLGADVAVSDFLERPTVAGLTEQIARRLFEQADGETASAALSAAMVATGVGEP
ncbi:MAG: amino acid adenylation domain-containing protein [Acidobacteriota bacterium]|nr:amino acid adenylation domain-containing protein [Acidobacteriota bacterium]